MITVRSTINLAHQSVPNVIPAVQGDTGRSILFTLADFTIPAGATARYFITKPSGLAVYNDATIDGNTVLVDLTAQSLAEYGDCPGQVRIMLGQTVVTSFEFILHVEPFRGIDAVESTNETNIFDQAIEEAEEYISQAIDPTLTIANKAADAKATGDAIWSIFPTESAQGNPATFDDGADNIPVKDLKVSIVPTQDLHGYDKPWAGGAGKNLLPLTLSDLQACNLSGTWSGNVYTHNGITFTVMMNDDGNITGIKANGTASGNGQFGILPNIQSQNFPYGGMTLSGGVSNNAYIQIELASSPYTLYAKSTGSDSAIDSAITGQGTKPIASFIRVVNGQTLNNAMFYPMIRASGDATFAPYTNICPITGTEEVGVEVADDEETKAEYTIPLDRTVYGGTLDVTTGVLTVDWKLIDLGDLTWYLSQPWGTAGAVQSNVIADISRVPADTYAAKCSQYYVTQSTPEIQQMVFSGGASALGIRSDVGTVNVYNPGLVGLTAAQVKEYLTGVKLVYKITTPQTYQLTPQEVRSLYGVNHISTDCESVDVIYRADIGLYIGKLIPSAQTLSMARPTLALNPVALDEPEQELEEEPMEDIEENEED